MTEYKLKFEIKLQAGMALTTLTVHDASLDKDQLDEMRTPGNHNIIKGEIKFKSFLNSVTFLIEGVSNKTHISGTFNFTCKGIKVFTEDEELSVNDEARISYFKTDVTLPC